MSRIFTSFLPGIGDSEKKETSAPPLRNRKVRDSTAAGMGGGSSNGEFKPARVRITSGKSITFRVRDY